MSNIVSVWFTCFQDLDAYGNPVGEPSYGYRIYDDYGEDYNNCYESFDEMRAAGLTRENIFAFIAENHDDFDLTAREKGVYLNGDWIAPPKKGDAHSDAYSDVHSNATYGCTTYGGDSDGSFAHDNTTYGGTTDGEGGYCDAAYGDTTYGGGFNISARN